MPKPNAAPTDIREVVARLLYFNFVDYEEGTFAEMTWREAPRARKDICLTKADRLLSELTAHGAMVEVNGKFYGLDAHL